MVNIISGLIKNDRSSSSREDCKDFIEQNLLSLLCILLSRNRSKSVQFPFYPCKNAEKEVRLRMVLDPILFCGLGDYVGNWGTTFVVLGHIYYCYTPLASFKLFGKFLIRVKICLPSWLLWWMGLIKLILGIRQHLDNI